MDHLNKRLGGGAKALVEVAFILFLFYANLLMGQYVRTVPRRPPLLVALRNIVTLEDFLVGLSCAVVGHVMFDWLRRRL